MTTQFLLEAVGGSADDSDPSTDSEASACDRKDEKPLHEAISHTATETVHAASDAGRSCSDQKKGKKQRQPDGAVSGKSAKIHDAREAVSGTDRPSAPK